MKTLSLFKQKPKVVKYRPAPKTRLIGSLDLDRKGELEKFKKWLEFASKEKSDLPKEDEIKKLNKDIEKHPQSMRQVQEHQDLVKQKVMQIKEKQY